MDFKMDTSSPTVYSRHQARDLASTGRLEVSALITPLGTDSVQVTPDEHVLVSSVIDIMTEDSVINMVTYLNADIQLTLVREALEDALINGDVGTRCQYQHQYD